MDYNFHTHTYLCGHASGTIENYIKTAISGGIKYMGFSEHFPLKFSDGTQSPYRLKVENIKEYFDTINSLREKHKEQIDIKIGFEMEYYEQLFDEMLENAVSYGAEYLILGPHYILPDNRPDANHTFLKTDDVEFLKEYVETVIAAIKKQVFTYVAHPDLFNFSGDKDVFKEQFRKICVASRKYNTPLEINFLGIREGRNYPNEILVQVMGEEKCPVTFGFDAHAERDAFDEKSLKTAEKLVLKYNLNYIGKPEIKKIG